MRSDQIKRGIERTPHRALLKATGVTDADLRKPFIAIVNSYVDVVPGHVPLQAHGKVIKDAVRSAGGVPFEFNTIGVNDGIAMGQGGMKYSLPSRRQPHPRIGRKTDYAADDRHGRSPRRRLCAGHGHGRLDESSAARAGHCTLGRS